MKFVLIFAVIILVPLIILLFTNQEKKRGCGRGCATCGNRDICYRQKKLKKRENAQKNENNFDDIADC